jgi:hypothetical protein
MKTAIAAKDRDVAAVVTFAVPIQSAHVATVREHSLRLASSEDASEEA